MKVIETVEDLRCAYPDLVEELTEEVRREVEEELIARLKRLLGADDVSADL